MQVQVQCNDMLSCLGKTLKRLSFRILSRGSFNFLFMPKSNLQIIDNIAILFPNKNEIPFNDL
jgi:hypothetical protein